MKSLLLISAIFCSTITIHAAVYYKPEYSFSADLKAWYKELETHDRMPETYVRFLAFRKLIKDFNPVQDEMLKASLEAEKEKNYGIKDDILKLSYDANREIEKRLALHQPFIDAMRHRARRTVHFVYNYSIVKS